MRGFEEGEYRSRLSKAQALMQGNGLDAILLSTEMEIRYFTGYQTRFWESPCRPWYVIVPADGKPIAVIPSIGTDVMARTWVEDIRTWPAPQPEDEGISLLIDALAPYTQIGTPMGPQSQLRMPLNDWAKLTRARPVRDDAGIVQRLRMIKSPAEIAKIQTACDTAARAFARVPEIAHSGVPLSQVFRDFQRLCLEEGADFVPYLAGAAAQGGYSDVISPASDHPLTEGDVLMLDTGLVQDGYFCDFNRNYAVGAVADDVTQAHAALIAATQAGFDAAGPDATAADLYAAMADIVGATGAGRLGHGLGLNLTEWPSITANDHTPLVPGMVMTLEPGIDLADGKMLVHEENIVITHTGATWLTQLASPTLPKLRVK